MPKPTPKNRRHRGKKLKPILPKLFRWVGADGVLHLSGKGYGVLKVPGQPDTLQEFTISYSY